MSLCFECKVKTSSFKKSLMNRCLWVFMLAVSISQASWQVGASPCNRSKVRQIDDMILDDDIEENYVTSTARHPRLWEYGEVFYEISPDLYPQRAIITKAMQMITSQARCIRFTPRYEEENYVYIDLGEGCNSYVGMVGGKQELNLAYSCLDTGNVLHELMHVLGFYHEHSRPDRDEHLNIFLENVLPDKKDNFIKLTRQRYRMVNEFDYDSIMIYGEYAFTRNGLPTMRPKDWLSTKGIRNPDTKNNLSIMDSRALQIIYQC